MPVTNHDMSSSGINLSLNCMRDDDLSRMNFENQMKVLSYSGYRSNYILAFRPDEEVSLDDLNKTYDIKDAETMFRAYAEFTYQCAYGIITESQLNDLIKEIQFYDGNITDFQETRVEDLKDAIYYHLGESKETMEEFLEEKFNPKYVQITSTGYCQGDFAYVIFYEEVLSYIRENFPMLTDKSNDEIAQHFKQDIDHLLWDQLVYCRLDINDQDIEIDLAEYLSDPYVFEEEEIMKGLSNELESDTSFTTEEKSYISTWVEENLETP